MLYYAMVCYTVLSLSYIYICIHTYTLRVTFKGCYCKGTRSGHEAQELVLASVELRAAPLSAATKASSYLQSRHTITSILCYLVVFMMPSGFNSKLAVCFAVL